MNIFLLFLSMFFMIGYYMISSPSQNLGYDEVQYEHQNSEMRSLVDCVVAKQNAFINNAPFNDECVKRYKINSTEVCTDEKFELSNCSVDPYYDFIITTSYKIDHSQYKDAFRIIDKTRQDFGTLGLFIDPNVIAANSIGKKLIPESVIKGAELENGQIAYIIQNSVQAFDPSQPDPGDDDDCRFTIFGKVCDDVEIEVCTGNEVWDEDQKKCVDQTGLCEAGKILLIDESDNSYYCVDPTSKICTGNTTLQYNHKLEAWECIEVENSDDTECDLSQFSLRLHSTLDSAAPTARIRTINCNNCEKRVLDESTCTIYCSPDASKLSLGECYNDRNVPLADCKGEKRGVYFGFAPGRTQYAVNTSTADESSQNSDIILNVEKFLDKDHLQDRLFHCFECANGMSDRLSFSPFSAMCKTENDEDDDDIVCADDEMIAIDQKTGKFYCEKIPEEPDEPDEPGEPDEPDDPHSYGISLSAYSGITTYPTAATFYVTENTSNGELTVQTSNPKIATASISGSIVTVKPVSKGKVAVYIRSAARGSYNVAVATYSLQINGANIVVNASDLVLEYNGSEQSCANVRVKNPATGAKVGYSLVEGGPYSSAPVLTDAASVTVFYQVSAENYTDLTGRYQCTLTGGQEGGVVLSASSGTITYPTTTTSFTASCLSGGTFSIKNSNPDVASANVDKDTVTLTYNKSGTAYITVDCPEYNGYLSANATYTLTVKRGVIEATAQNKTLTYSGSAQSCANVSVKSPVGANVTYSTSQNGTYSNQAPTLTNTGDINVYYKITADNYEDKTGSYKCIMSKGGNSTITLSEYSGTITYPETTTSFTATCNSGGDMTVKSDDKSIATATIHNGTVTVTYESAGETTIRVMCDKTNNYDESEATYNIVTQKGTLKPEVDDKYLTYSGSAQSCANTFNIKDVSSFTVKYASSSNGTYSSSAPTLTDTGSISVFYKIIADDYEEFFGNYKCTMGTGGNSLELNSYSGNTEFPNDKTIEVTKNISNGTLSAKSNKTGVATAVVKGSKVIITPVATGSAVITVTSAATSNYAAASVEYQLTVTKGTISASISSPSKPFDTKPLTCNGVSSVKPDGATVKYKTSQNGSYSSTVPTVTNVSDSKTIYYQITADNYETKEGVFSCSITSAGESVIGFSENSGVMVYPTTTRKFTATCNSGGTLSVASANTSVATASISGGTVTVTYKQAGETNIVVTCAATDNYAQSSKAYKITNQLGTITATVNDVTQIYDSTHPLSCAGVSSVVPTGATVEYKKPNGNYSTTVPTITNVEDSTTISYRITANNYTSKTGTFNCSVTKNATGGQLTITPTSGTITYPTTTTTFTANCTTGGTLSAASNKEEVATVSMSGNTGTVTYKGEGSATISVKCEASSNYGDLAANYSITTHKGTITADVNNVTKVYDGTALSCAGVSSVVPTGATVEYKKPNGNYSTTVPTITNVEDSTTISYRITAKNYTSKTGEFNCSVTQNTSGGKLTVTPTSGTITYPTQTTTFTANCTTGGTLSAASNKEEVATVSMSGNTGTVTYKDEGSATITVKCAATSNYGELTANYTVTTKKGTITADVNDVTKVYDGTPLSCDGVSKVNPSGATVKYSETENGSYSTTVPTVTNTSAKTIYYQISANNYNTKSGSFSCSVTKNATGGKLTITPTSGTITYPTQTTTFTANCTTGGTLSATSNNESVATVAMNGNTGTVTYKGAGSATITVKCAATTNYGALTGTYNVTTKKGTITATVNDVTKVYDGTALSCAGVSNVTPSGATVKYSTSQNGTYSTTVPTVTHVSDSKTIYYQITASNYNTKTGSFNCSVTKDQNPNPNRLTITPSSGSITIPTKTTSFTASCSTGGTFSVNNNGNTIATATINATTGAGTVTYVGEGEKQITITCNETSDFGAISKDYTITTHKGTITADVKNLSKTFDGSALTCSGVTNVVPSGATVKYSTSQNGTYSTTVPTVTNVSDSKTIYYQITASDYNTKTGSFNCSVLQTGSRVITITPDKGEITYSATGSNTTSFTATSVGGGAFTASSSNENVGTVSINAATGAGTVTYAGEGTATITVKRSASGDFGEGLGTYSLKTHKGTITATVNDVTKVYDGTALSCAGVSKVNPSGATVKYSETENGSYSTTVPTVTNTSAKTIYYQISANNYNTKSGSFSCSVTKNATGGKLTITPTSGTITYPTTTTTFTANCTTGGTLSATSDKESVATVSMSGNTGTVTYKDAGSATITVKCAATTNYGELTAKYTITTQKGTISATVNDVTKVYDGTDLSCAGVTDVKPTNAVVEYRKSDGTYTTSIPVVSEVSGSMDVPFRITAANYNTYTGTFNCSVTKNATGGKLTITPTSGTITYPTTTTTFTANCTTGGTLSATSDKESVATVSMSGNTGTVTYKSSGTATITVKCAATSNYNEQTATYSVTTHKGTIEASASDITLTYNGTLQSCNNVVVTKPTSGYTVNYSLSNSEYNKNTIELNAVDTKTIYYKVSATNYNDFTGSYTCKMVQSSSNTLTLSSTSGSVNYPNTKTFTVTSNSSGGALSVSSNKTDVATATISGATVTVTPHSTGTAVITVTSAATTNYKATSATYTITVNKGTIEASADDITLTYNGTLQSCNNVVVTKPTSGYTVNYSLSNSEYNKNTIELNAVDTKTIYYKVSATNYNDFTGSYTCKMVQSSSNTLTLSSTSGSVNYPNTKTFTVTSNSSGGALSVSSNKTDVATATISGTTVTVTPHSTGTAVITVTSAATANYRATSATYTITVNKGTIEASASDITLTYNGTLQSCNNVVVTKPTSGYTVNYSLSNSEYNKNTIELNAVDTKTIYYKVSATNYNDFTGSYTCKMVQSSSNTLTLSSTSGSVNYPNTKTFTVTSNSSGGALSVSSNKTDVATATISGATVTVTPHSTGTAVITVTSAATTNYKATSATYTITVINGTISASAGTKNLSYSGSAQSCANVTVSSPSGASVTYSESQNGTYGTTAPTLTAAGDSKTIYYKVSKTYYNEVSGSYICKMSNASTAVITLSEYSGTITYPTTTRTFTATCSSGGTLSVSSNKTGVATAAINTNTGVVTVTYKSSGSAIITINCAAAGKYGSATETYSITNYKGTITASASDVTLTYNGAAQSCNNVTVTKPSNGYTVSYSLVDGEYNKNTIELNAVDTKTIYYKVSAENYNDFTGSYTCKMVQSSSNTLTLSSTSGSVNYPNTKTFTVTSNSSGGALSVSSNKTDVATATISGATVTVTPHSTGTAVITVTSAETDSYKPISATYTITVNNGTISASAGTKNLSYSGSTQSCANVTVSSPSGASVTYSESQNGTYGTTAPTLTAAGDSKTIYYKVSKTYYNEVSGSYTCKMSDANAATVTLDKTSGTIVIPDTQTSFTASCNSGGALTVGSSNTSVATADINNRGEVIVNVQGTGNATITVYCAAYGSYGSASATFALQVAPGTIYATAQDKSLTYSGSAQSCANVKVTSPDGTSITYSTTENGTYTSSAPTLTSGSSSTPVWYKVSKTNYTTVSGHYNCSMSSAGSTTTLSSTSGTLYPYESETIEVTCSNNGAVTAVSSNTNVATVDYRKNTVTINYINAGSATITVYCAANNGIDGSSATYSLTNALGTIEIEGAEDQTLPWDIKQMCTNIIVINPEEGAVVTYGETQGAYSKAYKVTVLGTTTVFYKVEADNFETLTGQYNCTVEKGTIRASASDKELTYTGRPQSCANVTVSQPTSGATVQYSTDKVTYSDSVYLTNAGDSKTIYYRVRASYYNEATGQYTCTVKDNSSTIGCAEPTADCCLENGGTVINEESENAPTICKVDPDPNGGCPDGFTYKTEKNNSKPIAYCEQEIVVK